MYPPSKQYSWNERPRHQDSTEISRQELKWVREYPKFREIERIKINRYDYPEYVKISWVDKKYVVNVISPNLRRWFSCKKIDVLIEYLYKNYDLVSVI